MIGMVVMVPVLSFFPLSSAHTFLVDPYIFDFAVEPVVVAVGQRFNLTCRAGGYPHPEHPDFHLAKYIPVSNMSIFNHTIPVHSGVLSIVQDVSVEYSGNYTCVVNTQYLRTDGSHINMHITNSTAMVTVYGKELHCSLE